MNETVIKEIKSIYSGKIKSNNPTALTPEIMTINPNKRSSSDNKSFFNGVIDKLNIITKK